MKKILRLFAIVGLLFLTPTEAYLQQSIPTGSGSLITQSLLQTDGGKKLIGDYFATNYGKIFKIDTMNNNVEIQELVDFGEATNSTTFHKVGDTLIVHTYAKETLIFNQQTSQVIKLPTRKWFTSNTIVSETNTNVAVFNKTIQTTTTISKSMTGSILNEVKEIDNTLWLAFSANGYDNLIEFDLMTNLWFVEGAFVEVYRTQLSTNEKYFLGGNFTTKKLLFIDSVGYTIENNIPFVTSHITQKDYGKLLMSVGVNAYSTDKIIEYDALNNTMDTVFSFNEAIQFFYQISDEELLIATANEVFLIKRDIISNAVNIEQPAVAIYPNPSKNWIAATWKGNLSIFNNLGQVVLEMNDYNGEQLPVQQFPNGVYYMRGWNDKNETWSDTFVIQR